MSRASRSSAGLVLSATLLSISSGLVSAQTMPPGYTYEPVVTSGLVGVSTMAFAPDGRLFLLERKLGHVRVIENGNLDPQPWYSVGYTSPPSGESGLVGLAVDPDFLNNGYLYIFYTSNAGGENLIARVRDVNGSGQQHTILTPPGALPTHPFRIHNGGPLDFGPDGKLYVSSGDVENQQLPQNPSSWAGKILRFNAPNLSIPSDNPNPGSPVWATGVRNMFGLAWHPTQPWLFSTENGDIVGDEVNRISVNSNLGWPLHEGSVGQSAYVDPLLTISPQPILTGMSFYSGDLYPSYSGDLFMCQWLQGEVRRLVLNGNGTAVLSNNAFSQHIHSFDIESGPDGNLWILHGQSLQGGSEVGRYVHVSTPATTTEIAPVSGPALGGSVTIGVRAPANRLVVPWLSFSTFPTPVPTAFGNLSVVPDVPLSAKSSGASGSAYYGISLPNVPSFVGTQLWSQSISLDVFTLASQMSNVSETILR